MDFWAFFGNLAFLPRFIIAALLGNIKSYMSLFFLLAGPEPFDPELALLARLVTERERLLPRPIADAERDRLVLAGAGISADRDFHTTFGLFSNSAPAAEDDDEAAVAAEDIVV